MTMRAEPAAIIRPDRAAGEMSLEKVIAFEARPGRPVVCDLDHAWSFDV
jgi:hypothetical protein